MSRPTPRATRPATWSWITAPWFEASSTTTRAVHSIPPDCEWPRLWTKYDSRSVGTWARGKGVRGEATEPTGDLHRQGLGVGEAGAGSDPTPRRDDRAGGRHPGRRSRRVHLKAGRFRGDPRTTEGRRGPDPQAAGRSDGQLRPRPLRRRRRDRPGARQPRPGALVSPSQ